ncbi:MAG TPA: leucyl aminopeptidase [Solirubrobacterales bacterium]
MKVEVTSAGPAEVDTDVLAVTLAEDGELPAEIADAAGAADAKPAFKKLALLHPERPARALVVGVGKLDELDAERLRVAAALAAKRAAGLDATSIAWVVPSGGEPGERAAALVEGTILAAYRFDRYRSRDADDPAPAPLERLVLIATAADVGAAEAAANIARVAAEAANRARTLQNLPSNELTPAVLAERAEEIAAGDDRVEVEILDREAIAAAGMGGLVAVSQGSATEPRLIALRYAGGGPGPRIGLVGKAVTFDSGGISIKPSAGMQEMKMDMSGGAAVLESFAAVAELGLELDLVAAIPATENMPSGTAIKPGDIITQLNGKTVEVNNTDAEGRLILADALTYCVRELGAERLIDLATLTGAVLVALGSTYAALISNDDGWAATVERAATESGELAWRLPLHAEYKQLTRGTVADLTNAAAKRKAGTIYAGSFLEEFVDDVPWVHLDIAGTAWDTGREYVGKGATGFGVRLLLRLALDLAP